MDKIITDPKILHQVSRDTTPEEVKSLNLQARLREAMKDAWCPGLGLAAIQIGIPLRYAWYRVPKEYSMEFTEMELINPVIISTDRRFEYPAEGCLSIPNTRVKTPRYLDIVIGMGGPHFAATRLEAVLIQHEIMHMDGILITDIELNKYPRLGRNDKCGCLSGRKYKYCCLR
jgi:peptide deformylase